MYPSRCAIAATEAGTFGRSSTNRGHVDDFVATTDWCASPNPNASKDPYKDSPQPWVPHNHDWNNDGRDDDDCLADFMGANIYGYRRNSDGNATVSFSLLDGAHYKWQPASRFSYNNDSPISIFDFGWGFARYVVEMAGYYLPLSSHTKQTPYIYYNDVADYWTQNIKGYRTDAQHTANGVTESDIKNEINAGRPVIAIVTKLLHHSNPDYWYDPQYATSFHAFPVFGYKEDTGEITEDGPRLKLLCYDTWYEDSTTGTSYRIVDFPTPTEVQCHTGSSTTLSLTHYSACSDDSRSWKLIGFTFLHINDHDRCPDPLGVNDYPSGVYPHAFDICFNLPGNSRVHYTVDGTDPNPNSDYVILTSGVGTLRVDGNSALKFRTYRNGVDSTDGYVASRVVTRDYTIHAFKDYSDGDSVSTGALVATVGTGPLGSNICYVADRERVCGIRVQTSSSVTQGDLVTVSGTLSTNSDGERVITSAAVTSLGATDPITPLGMPNRTLGGADLNYNSTTGAGQQGITDGVGLNNIGLLLKTTGCICSYSASSFEITDGSPQPITVITPSGVDPPESGYVGVTGMCSRQSDGNGGYRPVLLIRSADDINDYGECECSAGGSQSSAPIGSRPEVPVIEATDTIAWALKQTDGTIVTAKACSVLDSAASGLTISDGWMANAATIHVQGNWAVNQWSTVDVTGVVTTLPGGTRAITPTQILVYTDSRDRRYEFPMPFWRDPSGQLREDWLYKEAASLRSM